MTGGVLQPDLRAAPVDRFGPSEMTHWSSAHGLRELGTYRQVFLETGESEPWTLHYEESVYVVDGEAWIVEIGPDGERRTSAGAGSLTIIHPGTTVRYGGTAGTVLVLSISPVDWADAQRRSVEQTTSDNTRTHTQET